MARVAISACLLLLIAALANTKAQRTDGGHSSLDSYITTVLENLKPQLSKGIPELGLPVMEPYLVPTIDRPNLSEGIVQLNARVEGLAVSGLSNYQVNDVNSDLQDLSVEIKLTLPRLQGNGRYKIDGRALGFIPLFGEGPMFFELRTVTIDGFVSMQVDGKGFLRADSVDLAIDFTSIQVRFDNLLGGGAFGDAINQLLNTIGPQVWAQAREPLMAKLEETLQAQLNARLSECPLSDIINGRCKL